MSKDLKAVFHFWKRFACQNGLNRRDLIKGVAATSLGLAAGTFGAPQLYGNSNVAKSKRRNRIQLENAERGTRDWLLTKTDINDIEPVELWRSPRIEGYCSETSVSAGDTIKVMVSTNPVSQFDLEIFRTGYYGGTGGRFMKRFDSIQGKTQADPPIGENRLRECQVGTFRRIRDTGRLAERRLSGQTHRERRGRAKLRHLYCAR